MADQTRKKARGKQPISRHPLFPAIVALWTGVLFGLCGLVFSPPLGAAARILLALAAFAVGCLLGLMMARKFAHAVPPAGGRVGARTAENEQTADEKRVALWSELKSLTAEAKDDFAEKASQEPPRPEREPEVLDLANVHPDIEIETAEMQPSRVGSEAKPSRPPAPLPTAAERIASAELSELSHVELLERLALSMQRRGRPSAVMPILQEEARAETAVSDRKEDVLEDGYRALRSLGRPTVPTTDRSYDAAGASSPPQSPVDTEKALRDALAALQRMSGAA